MVTEKSLANLKPLDITKEKQIERGRKGGKAKTQAKKNAAIIRELEKKLGKNIPPMQKQYLKSLKTGELDTIFTGLIGELLTSKFQHDDLRLRVLDRIVKYLPQKIQSENTNYNFSAMTIDVKIPKGVEKLLKNESKLRINRKTSTGMDTPK